MNNDFEVLKKALALVHERYDWSDKKLNFESEKWDEESLKDDWEQMNYLRHQSTWTLKKTKTIFPSMENLALCVEAARIIYGRYKWDQYAFSFNSEIIGTISEIKEKLISDFELLYRCRKDMVLLNNKSTSPNQLALSTLEGLIFQAITSITPFSVKRLNDLGRYDRVLRCLEGLLYQIIITLNPKFPEEK